MEVEPLDGMAIATPRALQSEQAIRALDRGPMVFCRKRARPRPRHDRRSRPAHVRSQPHEPRGTL